MLMYQFISNLIILISINQVKIKPMSQSKFKKAQSVKIPDEFICPISQTIMRDPVFNDEGTTFDRKVVEQWIDKHGTDPFTRRPLSKKDLKPNRALREAIYKFVQGLSNKQKEQLQHMNVYQIAKIREKELEDMKYSTSSPQREVSKLIRQLEIAKDQLFIQRQQKEFAIKQCEIQKKKAAIDKKKLSAWEHQMVQIKELNSMLEQKIKQSQKENQFLNKENLELRQLQKRHCQEIQELQKKLKDCQCGKQKHQKLIPRSRNLKITPDKQSRGLKEGHWVIDNTNSNVCIRNINSNCNWLCSSALPFDGEFVFTIKVLKLTDRFIAIGVMEEQKKGEQKGDTFNYSVYLNPYSQMIWRPNEEQTSNYCIKCQCSFPLPKCPFQIECHVNRQQNTIAWHYYGKQQAKSMMPKAWKTNKKQLCAIVRVSQKGDSVEMM